MAEQAGRQCLLYPTSIFLPAEGRARLEKNRRVGSVANGNRAPDTQKEENILEQASAFAPLEKREARIREGETLVVCVSVVIFPFCNNVFYNGF